MIMHNKKRYVLIETTRPFNLEEHQNLSIFTSAVLQFLGVQKYAKLHLRFAKQLKNHRFAVRIARNTEDDLLLALSFLKEINSEKIGFHTLFISGSIKTLKEKERTI